MRIFISAGEASGDAYGAVFAREVGRLSAGAASFEGIGGRRMREAGVPLHADSDAWGAISIVQSVRMAPRVVGGYYRAKRRMAQGAPGLFVPIDFGYVNMRLARHAKNNGWKVLYFVPPGSWRRDRQGADLPGLTDAISTPFEWSAEILRGMGANAHWFGHPIKQLLREADRGIERTDAIAVLPGSRVHEISENLPLIAETLRDPALAGLPVTFALAPAVDRGAFIARWSSLAPGRTADKFEQSTSYAVLSACRAGIVCSGTATLEAALCRCPLVVVYRLSKAVVVEARLLGFKRPKFIALPNILLDRFAVPELVQAEASPEASRAELIPLLTDSQARSAQLDAFEELDKILGPNDAITKTAELALTLIEQRP